MTSTARAISAQILDTATMLRVADPAAVPLAFWDFDGTLIEGDCSEGLENEAGQLFAGLVEVAIARGLSHRFSPRDGHARCRRECQQVIESEGLATANAFLVRAFAGASLRELLRLSRSYFSEVLRPWLFVEAIELWHTLEAAGVRCFVLSASADFFVKGAASLLHVAEDRIHGIRLAMRADDLLADEIVEPLTFGEGKAARMHQLLAEMSAAEMGYTFWPIAAFGNHHATDGPLLEAVARTTLPAGEPVSVVVNDVAPHGQFRQATFQSNIPTLLV